MNHDKKLAALGRAGAAFAAGAAVLLVLVGCGRTDQPTKPVGPVAHPARVPPPLPLTAQTVHNVATTLISRSTLATSNRISGLAVISTNFATLAPTFPATNTGSVKLAFDPSPDPNVIGYRIYYGSASGSYDHRAEAGNHTTVTVTGLPEGQKLYFSAVSYDATGAESQFSNEVSYQVPVSLHFRVASYALETYGVAGFTNVVAESTDLVSWQTLAEFIGQPGVLFRVEVANETQKFFRVTEK